MPPEMLPPLLEELYVAVSPDGTEHWDVVADKIWQMIRREPDLELPELANVLAPTLLIVADDDLVTIPQARAMERALPKGRLVVVPDATHGLPMQRPEVVATLAIEFLDGA